MNFQKLNPIAMNSETITHSPEETLAFGKALAEKYGPGTIYALESPLGGGKTVLSKGLALGYGVKDPDLVTSPTFTLVNCYQGGRNEIYHIDLYRLNSSAEAIDIGIEEMLASGKTVIIEWAERIKGLLSKTAVLITIETSGISERIFTVTVPSSKV